MISYQYLCAAAVFICAVSPSNAQSTQTAGREERLEILQSYTTARFRYVDKGPGQVTDRDFHYNFMVRPRLNLTHNLYIQARAETGDAFGNDMNKIGMGNFKPISAFNVKTLFLGARAGKLETQIGSMEFDQGAGSQATLADNDGWMTGYRVRYAVGGSGWVPSRISVTAGYAGDFTTANVFSRFDRMADFNYLQIAVQNRLAKNLDSSAELDSIEGIRYFRAGVTRKGLRLGIADEAVVESIVRATGQSSFGWSSTLVKNVAKRGGVRVNTTYSHMPMSMYDKAGRQVMLNGDMAGLGKRFGTQLRFSPFRDFEVMLFASRRVDNTPGPRNRAQAVVRYHLGGLMKTCIREAESLFR